MPQCLKCGAELPVDEEGHAPVLCDRCAGHASSRARRGLNTGTLRDFPATTLLMGINIAVFVAMLLPGVDLGGLLANIGPLTLGGEYWRLVTAGFVHAGFLHIAFNMWCLWSLGRLSERLFGHWQTAAIYLLTGVGGSLLSIAYDPGRSEVGASGAIFGIAGAALAGLKFGHLSISSWERRSIITSVVIFAAFNFYLGTFGNTDNMCHLGGFVSGLLVGLPLGVFARHHKLIQLGTLVITALLLAAAGQELVKTHGDAAQLYVAARALRRGDFTTAIPVLEKYAAAHPNDDEALVQLGGAYALSGQRDRAIAAFQQALKANPQSEPAKDALQTLREETPPMK